MKKPPSFNPIMLPMASIITPFLANGYKVTLNHGVQPMEFSSARVQHRHQDSHGFADGNLVDNMSSRISFMQRAVNVYLAPSVERMPCSSCTGFIDYPRVMTALDCPRLLVVVLFLWIFVLIWLLNTTAQDFFVPPLVYWSRLLRLRPEVAGATLVAFGNGAPDVFAMSTATKSDDLPLALCELLGANMCVLCIAGGAVVLACHVKRQGPTSAIRGSKCSHEAKRPGVERVLHEFCGYAESIACYAATLVYLAILLCHRRIYMASTAFLPLIYVVYLAVLIPSRSGAALQHEVADACGGSNAPLAGLSRPEDAGLIGSIGWALAWPSYALRHVLIPPADVQWDRTRRTISSLAPTGLLLLIAAVDDRFLQLPRATQIPVALVAFCTSCTIYRCSGDGPEIPRFYPCLTLLSKISSIIVLKLIADELTAVVESCGWMYNVPRLWLASTAVAWGNSLGDLVTGVAMVHTGQTRMAFTSIFAGPLFNCTVGGGVALLCAAYSNGGTLLLGSTDIGRLVLLLNVGFLGLALASLAIMLLTWRRSLQYWPGALFVIYALFLAVVLCLEEQDVEVNRADHPPR